MGKRSRKIESTVGGSEHITSCVGASEHIFFRSRWFKKSAMTWIWWDLIVCIVSASWCLTTKLKKVVAITSAAAAGIKLP